jgi:hypothetical protein
MKRTLARALHRIACRLYPLPHVIFPRGFVGHAEVAQINLGRCGIRVTAVSLPKIAEPPKVAPLPDVDPIVYGTAKLADGMVVTGNAPQAKAPKPRAKAKPAKKPGKRKA